MAVGIGNTSGNSSYWAVPGSPPYELSWSHTVGSGSNRILIVCAYGRGNPGTTELYTSDELTYGASHLTLGAHYHYELSGFAVAIDMWYLLNPSTGTDTITVRWNEDLAPGDHVQQGNGCAIDIYDAAQQPPEATNTTSYGGGGAFTDLSIGITTVTDGALMIEGFAGDGSPLVDTYDSSQTSFFNENYSSALISSAAYKIQATAGSTTLDSTLQWSANRGSHAILAFAESGAGPAPGGGGFLGHNF